MSKQRSLILQTRHIWIYRLANCNSRGWINMRRYYHRLRMEHSRCLGVSLRWSMPRRIKSVMCHSFRWIACRKSLLELKSIIRQRHFKRRGLLYIWKISHPMNNLSWSRFQIRRWNQTSTHLSTLLTQGVHRLQLLETLKKERIEQINRAFKDWR